MNLKERFRVWTIDRDDGGSVRRHMAQVTEDDLPPGEILVKVDFSSLNYKDALAAMGHPGIVRHYPHVPGIDAAGVVVASGSTAVPEGCSVLITGFGLGTTVWGGFAEYVRVPPDWALPLPDNMTPKESMSLGTAGLTAALCVDALIKSGVTPESGEILVSGATGGVGSLSVTILAKLGYQVAALTRKANLCSYLEMIGVSRIISHEHLAVESQRSLGKEEWAGAIDTLGGNALANILKHVRYGGTVASCGMASGTDLATTVFPFILRGVGLQGVDSVQCPLPKRRVLWQKLAEDWRVPCLQSITQLVDLDDVGSAIDSLLAGDRVGRTVVAVG